MGKLLGGGTVAVIALWISVIAAWMTHVVICIKTASWILLILGAVVFPIGIVHGVAIWFGWV